MTFSFTQKKEVKKFFIIFYVVGMLGMLIPLSFELFKQLIPLTLLLNFGYLAYFHAKTQVKRASLVYLFIFGFGLFIEIVGVNSGVIFGNYYYGKSLGWKIFETPILIGLNWLFLSYTSASVANKLKINKLAKIVLAALMMLILDLFLEKVAPKMDMWHWENDIVPIQNYVAWFAIALLFQTVLQQFRINTSNTLAGQLLLSQFIFFLILSFLL